jgi:tetratricopeptide (TPR) repeat protein
LEWDADTMTRGKTLLTAVCCALLALGLSVSMLRAHRDIEIQIADVTRQIEADPKNAELFVRRGELHRIHRDWPAAAKDYRRARKLDPELDDVDYFLGRMKLEAGLPKQAKKFLDRILAKEPGHARALIARARVFGELGQPLLAAEDYTRGLAAYGETRPAPSFYLERARLLEAAGPEQLERAIRGLDEGLERLGQPVTLQLYAIELEQKRGDPDAALARLERIASGAGRREPWLMRRGEILEQAGRIEEARDAYRAALAEIDGLSASRRGTRATSRLQAQAEAALERLGTFP